MKMFFLWEIKVSWIIIIYKKKLSRNEIFAKGKFLKELYWKKTFWKEVFWKKDLVFTQPKWTQLNFAQF